MAEDSAVSTISTEKQMERRVLAVVPSDPLQAYVEKGRENLLKDYYNPCSYFNKVYCLSPLEKTSGFKYGMHIIPTTAEQFATRIRELAVDIVRAYGGYWACDLACANKVEGIPVVVSVHDKRPSWLHNSICEADYVLTVSDVVKELVLSRKVPQEKIHYLPNSVNLNVFKPISDRKLEEQFKAQYPGKYRILHVGRKSEEKNLDTLIRALAELGPEYVCIFAGRGEPKPYQLLAKQNGVLEQCYFVETVQNTELPKYYSFCNCMCTPSRSEGFGVVFIEALACGAIVVTSDIAPMNEYITNDVSGILVKDFENPLIVAAAIVRACQEQSLRTYIRPNARKAAQPFNKEAIEQMEMNLYKKFLHLSKSSQKIDVSQHRQVKSTLGPIARKTKPHVSIVLPTYNHMRFLPKAIESILTQTYPHFELIIVNDGSTDGTRDFLDSLKDPRIRVIHQGNKHLPEALNTGFRAAHGELLTWISSDNYCEPTFLEVFVSAMDANPNAGLAYSAFARINEHGQIIKVTRCPDMDYSRLLLSFPGMASFMYRRTCQDKVGFYDPALEGAEDWDMWLRIAEHFPIRYVPEILYYYRQHTESLTTRKSALVARSSQIVFENAINRLRHQSPEMANTVAPDVFLKAGKEFGSGNFVTAVKYIKKYKSLIDYSKLPRTLNTAKENDNIALSVVIVTYNRNEDLKKCLQSLSNQDAADFNFEVIVVDNGQSQLDTFKQYLDQYINCPINFNLSEGRNIGTYFARGDIVVFLDDDALVGSDYISSIKSAFDRFDIFGLRGRTYPKSDHNANILINIYDLGDKPFPTYCNQEGNSAFLRRLYLAMGGMDPLLFGHEGSDLTYRIIKEYKKPDKVIYWPDVIIYHDFCSAESFKQKKKVHRQNEVYLKYKHNINIFANRTDIEKYPLPLKQSNQQHCYDISTPAERLEPCRLSSPASAGPKVSIVISCYNCEKFLPECLDSIRAQTMHHWELFLLDDASTDETRSIIERYARMDSRIKTYYFNDNKGPYVRRNFAIQQANSDFIVIQDADDIMCPAKLEFLYDEIAKDDQLAVVGSFYRMFLEEFKGPQYADRVELPIIHNEIMQQYCLIRYICWHGSAIIRKALFDAIGPYDENPFGSDKFWLAKAAEYARHTDQIRFKNIPEYLTIKREHSSSQQGVLPTLDPRSRRAKYQTYWEYKLLKIREKLRNNPTADIKTELKNCKCNDYIERYGYLFQQWESQHLDDVTLCRFISRAVKHFNEAKFVHCIIILDSVEKIINDVTKRFKNYDLLRAMAYYAIDRTQQSCRYLNRETQNHNSHAAKKFISDCFEGRSKLDVRKWCSENNTRYNLRMIDIEKETDAEQQSHNTPEWCISAWQDQQENADLSPHPAQAQTGPLVSVIIPAYNAAKYITKAIEGVLSQNYKNFELIVIDDGSTDQTEDIVRAFKDERIKYLYQENAGLANAHNVGIKSSKGAFIIKLDADDMMAPDFIARHLTEFEKSPHADLVYCDDRLIDEDDRTVRVINRPEYADRKLLIRDLFRCGFPVVPFRTCIRKSVFDKIGFFDESLLVAEDYDMMRRFVKHNLKIHHLPAALYLRRMTSEGLSRQYSAEKASSHFEVVRRFTDTFAYNELFPDVAWDKIAPQRRQLHAGCLAAATYLAIGQAYVKSNSPICAKTAFDLACSQLNDSLKTDPENRLIQQLMQKSEILQARYQRAPQQAIR